ncbi:MAG: phosphoribosylformylglycinamidine synthase I [Sedimentisphaerales bacterium]|jgi:phosphoribosylformylglycinamidine synthase|nr:phosphoribosylformylglycinamidine synthase I [Sedimentisphaerales bacterium]HNY79522.1 phosphoribosylformylglycinamidine synthase I [Sedimentisphaerales bacterium]HOC62346.1 phosphoribosylformylglycinamidine synthase I [Sedimentisphaerales bacterium]HOH65504.1 phosphoribosylformylglycinamidine synthase I [Sedimentisphaerales bacterium]HPY50896.1 phosphoribosylformylglycinamidine synthase I [Sedimentisphaerales bacterium]
MAEVRALVLRAAGVNCDMETRHALELAGAEADRIHVNRLIEDKSLLDRYHILVFPGGFSYGDDVAAGRILANQIVHHLADPIRRFIDDGKLVLGICNGFQVLVKMGVLPGNGAFKQEQVTITYNDSGKFEDRWVHLLPQTNRCVFIEPQRQIYLPVAHGEGKVVTADAATLERLKSEGFIAYKYVGPDGEEGPYPINPNGSVESIAGLTDSTGRVLGLMPHPERFVRRTQHPHWTRLGEDLDPDGIKIFRNAVRYAQENLLQSCSA